MARFAASTMRLAELIRCTAPASATTPFAGAGDIFFGRRIAEPNCSFAGDLLDILHELQVIRADQRNGLALAAGSSGTTDAVDIVVGSPRQIEIEDVRHVRNVETAGRNVGGGKQHDLVVAELVERLGAGSTVPCRRAARRR